MDQPFLEYVRQQIQPAKFVPTTIMYGQSRFKPFSGPLGIDFGAQVASIAEGVAESEEPAHFQIPLDKDGFAIRNLKLVRFFSYSQPILTIASDEGRSVWNIEMKLRGRGNYGFTYDLKSQALVLKNAASYKNVQAKKLRNPASDSPQEPWRHQCFIVEQDRSGYLGDEPSPGEAYVHIVESFLGQSYLTKPSRSLLVAMVFIFYLAIASCFFWLNVRIAVAVSLSSLLVLWGLDLLLFIEYRNVVNFHPFLFGGLPLITAFGFYENLSERKRLLAEQTRLSTELRTAHDMQMGLMPKQDPVMAGFDLSGICNPASEVGGDFYDYVWLDGKKTKLGIAMADVSGKAMKAAMTAVMTSGMLYSESQRSQSPRKILARINQPLYLRSDKRVFTALSFAVIDSKTKKLIYSSAGQSHPILIRNGVLNYIRTGGARLPLGVKDKLTYRDISMKLRKGDTVVFYTDGVPEAMNTGNQLYGFDRFEGLLKQNQALAAKELRDKIVEDVRLFTESVEQHDDMTVVVVKSL